MSQIALPLDTAIAADDASYIVTDANARVHDQLQDWKNWPNLTAILVGDKASGKSAIAQQFARETGGYVVDDARQSADDDLFHLWNRAKQEQKPLLLTASESVSAWNIDLPDLQSRLASSLMIEIGPPDEAMIEALLQKYFALRGLSISEDALSYLGKRMERSYEYVQLLAQNMDVLAIERKKPITRAIAMEALAQQGKAAEKTNDDAGASQNVEED